MVLVLFYFNGIILFAITGKELHVRSFKLWAFLCYGEGPEGIVLISIFLKMTDLDSVCVYAYFIQP